MNIDMIMKTDVLDIVFENRNKTYGAYTLRKFYNKRLVTALTSMLGFVLIVCSLAFIPTTKKINAGEYIISNDPTMGSVNPKDEKKIEPPLKPKGHATQMATQENPGVIKIIKDSLETKPIENIDDNIAIGNTTKSGAVNGGGDNVFNVGEGGDGNKDGDRERKDSSMVTKEIVDVPLDYADVQSSMPGGMNALRRFLERNLQNPKEMEEGELVSVKVRFVVGYDGKLQKFEIIEDGGTEFNNEVIRVLKKMPDWIPGKSNGRNVPVYYVIPVKFRSAE